LFDVLSYILPIIADRLSPTDYRRPIIAGRLSPADYRRPIIASLPLMLRLKIKRKGGTAISEWARSVIKKHGIFMPLSVEKIYTVIEQNVIFFPGSIRKNHLPYPRSLNQSRLPIFIYSHYSQKLWLIFFELVCSLFCSTVIAESAGSAKTTKYPHCDNENLLGV